MASPQDTRATLHLKIERPVRDQLLGKLRSQGMTMQHFFETLMHAMVASDQALEDIQAVRRKYAVPPP